MPHGAGGGGVEGGGFLGGKFVSRAVFGRKICVESGFWVENVENGRELVYNGIK